MGIGSCYHIEVLEPVTVLPSSPVSLKQPQIPQGCDNHNGCAMSTNILYNYRPSSSLINGRWKQRAKQYQVAKFQPPLIGYRCTLNAVS